jgi:toxin-antitoxin system PIN domain toxin
MKIVDLNILLYAVNENAAHHSAVLKWWEDAVGGHEALGLPWVVLLGFIRLATNPTVFPNPLDIESAVRKIDTWLSLDPTCIVHAKEGHWDILRSLLADSGAAGNLTTDAHLATLAISHGAVLVSCDNDFARFRGLRWENPIRQPGRHR